MGEAMHFGQHVIGICADNHTHLDLIDILMYGSGFTGMGYYLGYKTRQFKRWLKLKLRKL